MLTGSPLFDGKGVELFDIGRFWIPPTKEEVLAVIGDCDNERTRMWREHLEKLRPLKPLNIQERLSKYPAYTPALFELLTMLLKWNPEERCTVDQALAHSYFDKISESEPSDLSKVKRKTAKSPISSVDSDDEFATPTPSKRRRESPTPMTQPSTTKKKKKMTQ